MRKCRHKACRSELPAVKQCDSQYQRKGFCGVSCLADHARLKNEQRRARDRRKEQNQAKERIKTKAQWAAEAQQAVNSYVRWRDRGNPCVSCGRHHDGQYHAGHYRSVGACPELRFNTFNINKQCYVCNVHLSSNAIDYRINLLEKYGPEIVAQLEGPNKPKRYSVDQLKRIKRVFRAKVKIQRTVHERKIHS